MQSGVRLKTAAGMSRDAGAKDCVVAVWYDRYYRLPLAVEGCCISYTGGHLAVGISHLQFQQRRLTVIGGHTQSDIARVAWSKHDRSSPHRICGDVKGESSEATWSESVHGQ